MESWLSGRFINSLRTVASGLPCFNFRFARDSGRTVARAGKTIPHRKSVTNISLNPEQRSADIQQALAFADEMPGAKFNLLAPDAQA
jgi:hypothetical protein